MRVAMGELSAIFLTHDEVVRGQSQDRCRFRDLERGRRVHDICRTGSGQLSTRLTSRRARD